MCVTFSSICEVSEGDVEGLAVMEDGATLVVRDVNVVGLRHEYAMLRNPGSA